MDFEWANAVFDDVMNIVQKMGEIDPTISVTYPTPDLLTSQYIRLHTSSILYMGISVFDSAYIETQLSGLC